MKSFARSASRPRPDVGLEQLTRALIGVTLDSLDALDGTVSNPQFRLRSRPSLSWLGDAVAIGAGGPVPM